MRTIRELRAATGESQAALARAIGCSAAQVAAWETGAAPLPDHRRAALAEHFGVQVREIDAPLKQREAQEVQIARLTAEVALLRERLSELEKERSRRESDAPARRRRGTAAN